MSTQVETNVKVTVITIAEIVSKIENGEKSAAKANARFLDYAIAIRKESDKRSWDETTASLSLKQAYIKASNGWDVTLAKMGTSKNARLEIVIPKDADFTVAQVQSVLDAQATDTAKVMRLAYPVNDDAAKQLEAAIEHNRPLTDYRKRIGVNVLLEIARGKTTLEKVLNPDKPAETTEIVTTGTKPTATTGTEPTAQSTESDAKAPEPSAPTSSGPMSVQDRFMAAIGACKADGLTYPEALRILNECFGKAN